MSRTQPRRWATTIDKNLRALIADLNAAGWETCSSCQGRTSIGDYQRERHTEHAFVSFNTDIPVRLRRRAKRYGLEFWNGNTGVSPIYADDSKRTFMTRNREFPDAVRKLFFENG